MYRWIVLICATASLGLIVLFRPNQICIELHCLEPVAELQNDLDYNVYTR